MQVPGFPIVLKDFIAIPFRPLQKFKKEDYLRWKLSRHYCDSFVILKVLFFKFNSDLSGKMFETNFDLHLDLYLLAQTLSELIL